MIGTIKKLADGGKGYGFISIENSPQDIFFHANSLVGVTFEELRMGDSVSFETEETIKDGEKKTNAINVQRA